MESSSWNQYGVPKLGADVKIPASAGLVTITLPRQKVSVGNLTVEDGGKKIISSGNLEIHGGVNLESSNGGALLEFADGLVRINAPLSGSEFDVIRVSRGRVTFGGASEAYAGKIELHDGAAALVSGDEYPLGQSLVHLEGGTLSPDGFDREVTNPIQFGGGSQAGGTVQLGETSGRTLSLSGPVQLGSGGTHKIVVFGNAVLSGGISGFVDMGDPALASGSPSSVLKRGPGLLVVGGPFWEVAAVTVEQGVLDLSAADDLIGGGTLVMAGGTLLLGRTSQAVSDLEIRAGVIQGEEGGAIRVADPAAQMASTRVLKAIVDTSATLNASILEDNSSTRLSKTGVGLLVLNRESDFSAGVELNSGILEVGTQLALGGSMLLWNGGTLRSNSVAQEIANPVRFQSANVMQIGGPSAGALTFSGSVDLGAKAALNVVSETVFAGVVSGGSLEMVGPGRLILSGTNTFVGSTVVSKGNLRAGQGGLAATSNVEVVGARLELVDFNPSAPMRVRAGGVVKFSESTIGSGAIVLEGGTLQARAGVSQILRPVSVRGGEMSVIAGGASTSVGHTQVVTGSSLKVQGVVEMKSLMLAGGVLVPNGVTMKTGSLRAAVGSQLTWDLRSLGGTAIEVTGRDKVEASDLGVSIPAQSLNELMSIILPSQGKALLGAGQSAVVGTLISAPSNLDMPQNFETGSATLRFRLNKQSSNSVVITVDRSTLLRTIKSARSSSFLAALDAVNAASDALTPPSPAPLGASASAAPGIQAITTSANASAPANQSGAASHATTSPVAAALGASAAAAQGSQSIANPANVSAPANQSQATSLVSLLRAIEQLQSAEQIRAILSPLDGGRGYADLTSGYGLAGLALSGPLDAHLDGLASDGFADSSVSFGVRATQATVAAHDDKSLVRNSVPHAARAEVWVAGYGLSSRLSADPVREYGALNASGGGSVFGLERRYGDLRFGGIVIVGQSTSRVSDPELNLETEHWNVGGYGSVRFGRVTVDGSALFGVSSRESERQLFSETAEADFKTKDWQLALGLSMNLAQPGSGWEISPVLRLKYLRSDQDGFDELGSMAPISSEPMVTDRLFSRVGLRLGRHSQVTPNVGLGVFGAAYWLHDFTARGPEMRFKLAGVPYQTRARDSEPDLLQFNMGVHASLFQSWTLNLAAQRDIGAERVQQTGVVSVGFRF